MIFLFFHISTWDRIPTRYNFTNVNFNTLWHKRMTTFNVSSQTLEDSHIDGSIYRLLNTKMCMAIQRACVLLMKQGKPGGSDSCDRPSYLKLDSHRQFCNPCVIEIWRMTSQNKRALLLYCVKFCASFQSHQWIQTGVTVQKRSIRVEIDDILSRVILKFARLPWNTIVNLFHTTSSFYAKPSVKSNFSYSPETLNSGNNWWFFFVPRDLDTWQKALGK